MSREHRSFGALDRAVLRHTERQDAARRQEVRSIVRNLGLMGALGWLFVTPALLCGFLGRWLDRAFGTGLALTAALLLAGIGFGGWLCWRRIQEQNLFSPPSSGHGPGPGPGRPDKRDGSP